MAGFKLVSWNVNGIRAVINKGLFEPFVRQLDADVICLQETKARPEQVDLDLPGYHPNWHWAEKKGYSGTLTLSRTEPLGVSRGMGELFEDTEGRVLTTEFPGFFAVNVYTPNTKRDLSRLPYRQRWDEAFCAYLLQLERTRPVIACGDINVAHEEIDLARPKQNTRTHGFTAEERAGFTRLIDAGFVDTFRALTAGGGHYSWWPAWGNARANNVGWRVDYVLISGSLRERLSAASIHTDIPGSDHCPVSIVLAGLLKT
jgi:exodeoxyribonuclease-3